MPYLDLTHPFTKDMPVFPGNPPAHLEQTEFLERDGCALFEVKTSMHVGTHVDAPMHMIEGGKGLEAFGPEDFIGRGVLLNGRGKESLDEELMEGVEIKEGDIVLIVTGWSKKFRELDYYESYPVITESLAYRLANSGAKMVGTDTPSPDRAPYEIHKILLSQDILILENLNNLELLLDHPEFEIIALPGRFEAAGGLVRAVAKVK